jgi:hypothetical protein
MTACSGDSTPTGRGAAGASGSFGNSPSAAGSSGAAGFGNPTGQGGTGLPPSSTVGDDDCAAISQTAANRLQPADIIFAIDNSQSMTEEILFVREQMNAFSQQIVDSGIDVHIIMISSPFTVDAVTMATVNGGTSDGENGICIDAPLGSGMCPSDSNAPRFLHVPQEVGSNDALNLFVDTYPDWRAQLRPNATKTFVVVTDDDATDGPNNSASSFTQAVAGLDATLFQDWTFSGIYCFSECPDAAAIGSVYVDLVAQTQGVSGDLCLQDFAPVFDALAESVIGASSVDCQWDIPPPPAGQSFDVGKVNVQYTATGAAAAQPILHVASSGECGAQGGWFYNDATSPTRVLVCPTTCQMIQADAGAKVDILFGCETVNVVD